jgi:hypothetical protein
MDESINGDGVGKEQCGLAIFIGTGVPNHL